MKTIKHLLVTLAIIGLSFFSSKSFGQVLVYASSWTNPGPSMCDGEKFQIFNMGVSNNTDTMIEFKEFPVILKNPGIIDSVFLLDRNRDVITGVIASQSIKLKCSVVIDKHNNTDFFVVVKPKVGKNGKFEIELSKYSYENLTTANLITYPGTLTATTAQVSDCSPKIKVTVYENNRRDGKYCESERPGAYCNAQNYWADLKTQHWYVDGKEVWVKTNSNQNIYLPGDLLELKFPKTKVLLEVTDALGRIGRDSIFIDVIKNPKVKIIPSSESFCSGKSITIAVDTSTVSSWSMNWGKQVSVVKKFQIFEGGTYYFQGFADNGCWTETSTYFYELPAQEKLTISYKDTVLWVNQKADTVRWFVDDIPINFQQNVINSKESGFYHVIATNSFGCKSISDKVLFSYNPPEDVLPTPDLAVSKCKLFANINLKQNGVWEWTSAKDTIKYFTNDPEFTIPTGKNWWKVRFVSAGKYSPYSNAVFAECISASIGNLDKTSFKVYPNPAIDQFNVESSQYGDAQLIDMQGRVVRTLEIEVGTNSFPRDGIAGGVYILQTNYGSTRIVFTN
jgi:hypothetical protein